MLYFLNERFCLGIALIMAGVALAVALAVWFHSRIKKNREEYVQETSSRLRRLLEVNERTEFVKLQRSYSIHRFFDSKSKFDRADFEDILKSEMGAGMDFYRWLVDSVSFNLSAWTRYCLEVDGLPSSYDDKVLNGVEDRLFEQLKLARPVTDPVIRVDLRYSSPKGRSQHTKSAVFDSNRLASCIKRYEKEEAARREWESSVNRQRSKMTPSLRHKVLKRDGYRCCHCGASASDGAKLEVDHIIPVSKGGLTELDNLQTLCLECNRGKGASL